MKVSDELRRAWALEPMSDRIVLSRNVPTGDLGPLVTKTFNVCIA